MLLFFLLLFFDICFCFFFFFHPFLPHSFPFPPLPLPPSPSFPSLSFPEPAWWPRMMWKEKGTFLFIIFTTIFLVLMGTLVDGWNDFSWEVSFFPLLFLYLYNTSITYPPLSPPFFFSPLSPPSPPPKTNKKTNKTKKTKQKAWYSVAVTAFTFYCLVHCTWLNPCIIMLFATTLLLAPEVITVEEATDGFGNKTGLFLFFSFFSPFFLFFFFFVCLFYSPPPLFSPPSHSGYNWCFIYCCCWCWSHRLPLLSFQGFFFFSPLFLFFSFLFI